MTTYLLDTNACIALINGTEINVRRRFKRAMARESVILLSSIVAFELWYGVAKSQRKDSNTQRLETFLGGPLEWALFDEDDARAAGTVRAELETVKAPAALESALAASFRRTHRKRPPLWWIPPLALAATIGVVSWMVRTQQAIPQPLQAAEADAVPFLALKPLERIALEPSATVVEAEFPRALLASLVGHATREDIVVLRLSVNTGNAPAIALYRSAGFEVYGTERAALRVDGVLVDEHLMERYLRAL